MSNENGHCNGFHDGKVASVQPVQLKDPEGGNPITVGWVCGTCGADRPGPVTSGWEPPEGWSEYYLVENGVEKRVTKEEHERRFGK